MDREPPVLHALPGPAAYAAEPPAAPWHRSTRARLFAASFGLTLLAGLVLTLLQPAHYRASATVLMSAPVAIDEAGDETARVQDVAIQRRILLGSEVTARLRGALADITPEGIDAQFMRDTLQVEAVPDTNLVEMAAEGADAALLPQIVDRWIDVYLDIRAAEIEQRQQQTLQVVGDQLTGLEDKVAAAREALTAFRAEHQIISAKRQENEAVARLEGLNKAMNLAVEGEIKARARVDSMEQSIASGERLVPTSDRESVAAMETELRQLRTQLNKLTQIYTLDFVSKAPSYREIPDRIKELEGMLGEVYAEGEQQALAVARQKAAASQQTVQQIKDELARQQAMVAEFTAVYAMHEALQEDLEELESLQRDTQARLVGVQVNPVDRYPQVDVIDRPGAQSVRLGPDYRLWLGGTLGAALAVGILCVWLYGFLGPRPPRPAYVTLSGVHMYPQDAAGQLAYMPAGIASAPAPRLTDTRDGAETDRGPADGGETDPDEPRT